MCIKFGMGGDDHYSFPVLSTMILLKDSLFSQGSECDWSLSNLTMQLLSYYLYVYIHTYYLYDIYYVL